MKADELADLVANRPLLTRADVMRYLCISVRTMARYQRRADFPKPQYVYGPRWTPSAIARWLKRQRS